jgi:1,2-phenylacetyl-CoA epoxidase PaaB subunit
MSVVRSRYHGEQIQGYGEQMALTRVRDLNLRRLRAKEMFVMKRAGIDIRQIAAKYRLTRQYAYQEIASIPREERERIAKFGLEGLGASFGGPRE